MKVGIVVPTASGRPARAIEVARRAEAAGAHGVFAPDHLAADGAPGLEPFTLLAAIAVRTERVLLGPLVARAAARPVGLLAKCVASIGDVSGGRSILGIGAGDAATSHDDLALARPFVDVDERRAHLRETLSAVRALLAGSAWSGGAQVPPVAGPVLPRPQRIPPIWIGGASEDVARIAASADGWNGWGLPEEAFLARIAALRGRMAGPEPFDVSWGGVVLLATDDEEVAASLAERELRGAPAPSWSGTPEGFLAFVAGLAEAGVTWITLGPAGGGATLDLLCDRVIPRVAG